MRHFYKHYYETNCFVLIVFTILSGVLLTSNLVSADDSFMADVSLNIPVACTMTGTIDTPHTATVEAGTYRADIGITTLKSVCNDSNGFSIYAIGYSGLEYGNNKMLATVGGTLAPSYDIVTGTATSGETSNWAMKLNAVSGTYAPTLTNGFGSYRTVPNEYTKVATFLSSTDATVGSSIQSTYAVYVKSLQPAGTYDGKVKYTLVHPNDADEPPTPQSCYPGYICYFSNVGDSAGTMGRQSASDGNTVQLIASNFSRQGYGFAGWSDAFDYATNANANFYGPNEDIIVPTGTTVNGLALYAVWIKSAGIMQTNATSVCNALSITIYNNEGDSDESTWSVSANLSTISALTDQRDNQTYAIAKLSDGNCWMIENLRLDNTATLTTANTNNPLNNGSSVILKHNYNDTQVYETLSASNNQNYSPDSAPNGWCKVDSAECDDQSRFNNDNTTNRVVYSPTQTMSSANRLYSYGNYYNWYSATAGRGTYSSDVDTTTPGDLCPLGWHLPTGTGSGEFGLLSNSLGGYKDANNIAKGMNNSTTPTYTIMSRRFRHFPNNVVYSGILNGSSNSTGSDSFYWSSTSNTIHLAYYLYLYTRVSPGASSANKYFGGTIRCILSS